MEKILIKYINISDDIKGIRNNQNDEAIGRYMEKYESGTSKPILVKKIDRKSFVLIDGHHRLIACQRLKKEKIDVEIINIDDKDIYSKAVEENQGHGVSLTKQEEENILIKLIESGKKQKEIAKIFGITREAISKRINRNPILKEGQSTITNTSTVNELLDDEKQSDIANNYDISQGRVSQIWGDFQDDLINKFNQGASKIHLIDEQVEKGINLTKEKLDEIIPEECNKLIFGDCLEELPKLKDESIDCVIIDPPYGIDYQSNYKKEKYDKISNDGDEAFKLLKDSLWIAYAKMKKNSHIYIFTSWKVLEGIKPLVEEFFEVKNCIVWNKNNWSMGDLKGNYAEKYELILFATKGKRNLSDELGRPVNVIDCDRTGNTDHPTQKPVELLQKLIRNSTKEGEIVLDYFAGSASTLQAAQNEKRKWIGIELKKEFK